MKRFLLLAVASAAVSVEALAPLYLASSPSAGEHNRYIVKLKNNNESSARIKNIAAAKTTSKIFSMQATELSSINAIAVTLSQEGIDALRNDSAVEYIDQVIKVHALYSWGIDRANQRNLPLDSDTKYGATGLGVDVYVVDTGVLVNHPQFEGRARHGYTAFPGDFSDAVGHGTHCAGTVASRDYGVAPNANIINVKVLGWGGQGTNEGVIQGLEYVLKNRNRNRPAVVSMSLGGGYSRSLNDAVERLHASGVTVVVAAGNENSDACYVSPASARSAITVAASTIDDEKADYSNYGACVDIIAPGSYISSTWNDFGLNTISGTSMAAPHVAGAVALYLSRNPKSSPRVVTAFLLAHSSSGVIHGFNTATPNRLLYAKYTVAKPKTQTPPMPTKTTMDTAKKTPKKPEPKQGSVANTTQATNPANKAV